MTVMTMDLKISSDASHLQSSIKTRLEVAERDSEEARKIFGIDQMSTEERKVELRKDMYIGMFPRSPREAEFHLLHIKPRSQ